MRCTVVAYQSGPPAALLDIKLQAPAGKPNDGQVKAIWFLPRGRPVLPRLAKEPFVTLLEFVNELQGRRAAG
ncbi:MAG: hypothetical protein L0332_33520 [Chloroflexi bacterium]|nr:hypothetical protein [Chloroflexota bacterium]